MAQTGGYELAAALGRAAEAGSNTLVVKTDAAIAAQNLYLKIVTHWQGVLEDDAKHHPGRFQADEQASSAEQAPANTLEQTEEGQAAQVPQNIGNIIRSCADIIGLFAFVAQMQASQS